MPEPGIESEVGIIGAGPVGLEVAWALRERGIPSVLFEAGSIGSTMRWWAPGTTFFSSPERLAICGVPFVTHAQAKATGEQYLDYLRQIVGAFDFDVRTNTRVRTIESDGEGFVLHTVPSWKGVGEDARWADAVAESPSGSAGAGSCRVRRLVLAIGNMHAPRTLGIPGEGEPFVSHYLDDPHLYFRKRVLIVGGKNSAVEAAIRLYRVGADVTVSYRQAEFSKRVKQWLRPELEWLIAKRRVTFLPETHVRSIAPDGSVEFEGPGPGARSSRAFDYVLLLTGYVQSTELFDQLGVRVHGEDRIPEFAEETMQSNVPGVYVAGTACGGTPVTGVKVFIETSHVHAERIAAAIAGDRAPSREELAEASYPES